MDNLVKELVQVNEELNEIEEEYNIPLKDSLEVAIKVRKSEQTIIDDIKEAK